MNNKQAIQELMQGKHIGHKDMKEGFMKDGAMCYRDGRIIMSFRISQEELYKEFGDDDMDGFYLTDEYGGKL